MKRIAIIRVHGNSKLRHDVVKTFDLFRLYKKHTCVVIPNTASIRWDDYNHKGFHNMGRIKAGSVQKNAREERQVAGQQTAY